MRRKFVSFPIADLQHTKKQMLNWANHFNICCFLDNHLYNSTHHSVECLLAAGSAQEFFELPAIPQDDWIFGHISYEYKNRIEQLSSSHPDRLLFPEVFFFRPQYVVQLTPTEMQIGSFGADHKTIAEQIMTAEAPDQGSSQVQITSRYSKQEYIETVGQVRDHIHRGDCYELNLCQEFYAENAEISPVHLFRALVSYSPNPFSAFYKISDRYALCLSPERYLRKEGSTIISQPMKGTAKRKSNPVIDQQNLEALRNSEKERAENIMVVDLVRNDLSRFCKKGTVQVDELCGIYSFPQVHQMVSTISGELEEGSSFREIIHGSFPMGSMTGAPKKKVMELIEKFELSRRGLFSGAIGYIDASNNFDFNVVIRTVLYNASNKYLSFHTGSAITFSSDPEQEYQECLLKASAIRKALAETNAFQ